MSGLGWLILEALAAATALNALARMNVLAAEAHVLSELPHAILQGLIPEALLMVLENGTTLATAMVAQLDHAIFFT